MRIHTLLFVSLLYCSLTHASELELDSPTLSEQQLASYRGGFQLSPEYTINIGLSITSAINGAHIFTTHIADLTIRNGVLIAIEGNSPTSLVNIIQSGSGNHVSLTQEHPSASGITDSTTLGTGVINIIQNTTDNSILGLSTVIDIEAQASQAIEQIKATQQLNDALMSHFH
ncbi:hypothetical protein [Vibrio agarivorans]|uniref:hypothetical protein n=1 Tax=Vibrio agarivorans TaxID=153622 RepID=UPI0025B4B42F|nr:hypothetical protein [Vibrio agarivorans]MDN3662432.1 hypothetical protein [Vibrio agarivorans]